MRMRCRTRFDVDEDGEGLPDQHRQLGRAGGEK